MKGPIFNPLAYKILHGCSCSLAGSYLLQQGSLLPYNARAVFSYFYYE